MANATVNRFGSDNQAGDKIALFLKIFAGEVMTSFAQANVFMDKHLVRTIEHGKSATFPFTGRMTASDHTVGAEIVGQDGLQSERVITIDNLVISDMFVAQVDELMNHYDARSIYSKEAGRALARKLDLEVAQVAYLAARKATVLTGGNGGTQLTDANYRTVAEDLVTGIFAAQQALDEKDVPEDDRWAFVKPAQYYLLANHDRAINKDFSAKGSISEGKIIELAGLPIIKTNNLPTTNITTGNAKYQGDFTNSAALVMWKQAVGTIKLLDIALDMEWDIRRQGTLIVAKMLVGHDYLRPDASVELKVA